MVVVVVVVVMVMVMTYQAGSTHDREETDQDLLQDRHPLSMGFVEAAHALHQR